MTNVHFFHIENWHGFKAAVHMEQIQTLNSFLLKLYLLWAMTLHRTEYKKMPFEIQIISKPHWFEFSFHVTFVTMLNLM